MVSNQKWLKNFEVHKEYLESPLINRFAVDLHLPMAGFDTWRQGAATLLNQQSPKGPDTYPALCRLDRAAGLPHPIARLEHRHSNIDQ